MFLFGQKSPQSMMDMLLGRANPSRPSAPSPFGPPAAPEAAPASPGPDAAAARSELASPFIDFGSQVAGGLDSLIHPVEDLAHRAGQWIGGLFGDGDGAAPQPAPAPSPAVPSGWAMAGQEDKTRDVTGSYEDLVSRAKTGENVLPEDAQKYAYLMVPGFLGDKIPTYLDPNMERMKALGLDPHMATIDTGAGVEENAEKLRDEIEKIAAEQHRQVVLTGQSKGGVDITAALAKYPELAEHVRAVVSMQAPYGGTPLAEGVESNPVAKGLADGALGGLFGGDSRAISDLTYGARQQFVGEHPYPSDTVPTVSLATSTTSQLSPLAGAGNYMRDQLGLASDGMVPTQDEIIPGSDVVRLSNMDHAGSNMVLPGRGKADSPGDVTEALLALALRKANEMDEAKKQAAGAAQ
jgi:hypothetical protein